MTLTPTETETLPETQTSEPGDHERFAHYVRKDKMTDATVFGTPIVALCGKKWVPSRDPEKFPICPECKEIYDHLGEAGNQLGGGNDN